MLDLPTVAFYVIAVVMVGSALAVVLLRNIVHAALFLALFFGAAAGVYVLLNAEFIAIVQVLIYAGAVTILVLFAIMLTQNAMTRNANPFAGQWWLAAIICVALAVGIIYAVGGSQMAIVSIPTPRPIWPTRARRAAPSPGWGSCSIAPSITAMCCPLKSLPSSYW